ncbi:carbon-nitrogen hydrolase [Clohesyomyces aquaticus]|uniref:Carbon-nitrogen hydrolase n=1 Tax=Clohesyomyces aquaticus TaxID=1231657 RepID=A0A1Y2A3Q1_9PLEO|nr:carbon-nitrogen hydrolase [Clohesyomyces aquaticus]
MAPQGKHIVAAAHASPVFMDKKRTIEKVVALIEQAWKENVKFLVFPETFVPGYPYFIECYPPLTQAPALAKYADESVTVENGGSDMAVIQKACSAYEVAISLGISERVADGYTLFNSQVLIDNTGTILGVHRKLQPTYAERYVWAQGSGATLKTWRVDELDCNVGGLACWEHTMNGARQALIMHDQHIHAGAWPALSTMSGFEQVADAQIEALMKAHALTAQCFVVTASNYVDQDCLDWMEKNLGPQDFVKKGGGWSAVIHPFCSFLAEPHTGAEEKVVKAEIDFDQMGMVKVWVDAKGHYRRPDVLKFEVDETQKWHDDDKVFEQYVPERKTQSTPSGYMFFVQEKRQTIRNENPDIKFGEVGALLGREWKKLSDDERRTYDQKAISDQLRRDAESKKYEQDGSGA